MCDFFRSFGSLFNIEALKRMVKGMDTMSLNSLNTLGCIWSGPGALDMFCFFSFFSDCVGVYVEVFNFNLAILFYFRVVVTCFCNV